MVYSVFKYGRSSTEDLAHPDHPPHPTPPHSADPDTQATVDQMVQCCCCIMLGHIIECLGISLECASHHHARSGLLKSFCSLGAEQFKQRTDGNSIWCFLGTSAVVWKRGRQFLDHIVEGYKSWCLHCDPETVHMCQQWKHPSSP